MINSTTTSSTNSVISTTANPINTSTQYDAALSEVDDLIAAIAANDEYSSWFLDLPGNSNWLHLMAVENVSAALRVKLANLEQELYEFECLGPADPVSKASWRARFREERYL